MTNAKWVDSLKGQGRAELTLGQATNIEGMIADGYLVHIGGRFVTALADLADDKTTEYRGLTIHSHTGIYVVTDGSDVATATDAIGAILLADEHLDNRPVLHEPDIATHQVGRGHLIGCAA